MDFVYNNRYEQEPTRTLDGIAFSANFAEGKTSKSILEKYYFDYWNIIVKFVKKLWIKNI